jgi:hypothetical protein
MGDLEGWLDYVENFFVVFGEVMRIWWIRDGRFYSVEGSNPTKIMRSFLKFFYVFFLLKKLNSQNSLHKSLIFREKNLKWSKIQNSSKNSKMVENYKIP